MSKEYRSLSVGQANIDNQIHAAMYTHEGPSSRHLDDWISKGAKDG
jgi:hypothetical protein